MKNILLLLTTLFILFAVLETGFRLNADRLSEGYRPSCNPRLVYEMVPGHVIKQLGTRIGPDGFNDRSYPLQKPRGVTRIAVVGDSNSFGWKIRREDSFPKVLEKLLNERLDRAYEVINFSCPGYNTAQEYELIRNKVLAYDPGIVILFFSNNDLNLCNYFQPRMSWKNIWFHKSHFLHWVIRQMDQGILKRGVGKRLWFAYKRDVLEMFYPKQTIYVAPGLEEVTYGWEFTTPGHRENVPSQYHYMIGPEGYKRHLGLIQSLLQAHEIEFISTGFMREEVVTINRELDIKRIFNQYDCLNKTGLDLATFNIPNDGHKNELGNRVMAECLYERVSKM